MPGVLRYEWRCPKLIHRLRRLFRAREIVQLSAATRSSVSAAYGCMIVASRVGNNRLFVGSPRRGELRRFVVSLRAVVMNKQAYLALGLSALIAACSAETDAKPRLREPHTDAQPIAYGDWGDPFEGM